MPLGKLSLPDVSQGFPSQAAPSQTPRYHVSRAPARMLVLPGHAVHLCHAAFSTVGDVILRSDPTVWMDCQHNPETATIRSKRWRELDLGGPAHYVLLRIQSMSLDFHRGWLVRGEIAAEESHQVREPQHLNANSEESPAVPVGGVGGKTVRR